MTRRERILRAVSAITGGFWLAVDHLRGDTPEFEDAQVPPPSVPFPCPMCDRSLATDLMHIHGDEAYWLAEHDGAILITDLAGGDTFIVGGAE